MLRSPPQRWDSSSRSAKTCRRGVRSRRSIVQKDPAYSQPLLDTLPQRNDGSGAASIMLVSMRSDTAESERMRESVKPLASRSVRYSASVRSRPPSNPSMCMSIIAMRR